MTLHLLWRAFFTALGGAIAIASMAFAADRPTPVMSLLVDETQEAQRVAFVHEEIRVHPGPLALAYTALVDTATEDWVLRVTDDAWSTLRRSQDYYDEGALIWLHADTIIRQQTQDRLSLDDFLRSFFGQRDTEPIVVPYTREEVEASLNTVCPYDWHTFFETRIYQVNSKPPTEGLEAAGWRLTYNSMPNNPLPYPDFTVTYAASHSIGIDVNNGGTIDDVLFRSPAYNAGLGPRMKIIAVDGQAYSADALNDAIARPTNGKITLLVQNFGTVESHEIHYPGGLRYPHLERIPGTHDYLSEIFEPRSDKVRQSNLQTPGKSPNR